MPLMVGQKSRLDIGFITADPSIRPQQSYSVISISIPRTEPLPLVAADGRYFLGNAFFRWRAAAIVISVRFLKDSGRLPVSSASFSHSIATQSIQVNQICRAMNLTFDNKTKKITQCAFPNSLSSIRGTTETAIKQRIHSFQVYPAACFCFFFSLFTPGAFNPPPSLKPHISSQSVLRQISATSHSSLMVLTLMTLVRQEEKKLILLTF